MSYQNAKLMNLEDGQKLLEAIDQHKAEIGTVAKNWEDHKTEAFAVGEYVIKDNVTYRFKAAHVANTAWNASEVEATNLGAEITGLKSALDPLIGKESIDLTAVEHQGAFLNTSANIQTTAGHFAYTDPIPVFKGRKYLFTGQGTTLITALCSCDASGNNRQRVFGYNETAVYETKEYTPTADGYIMVSYGYDADYTLITTDNYQSIGYYADRIDNNANRISSISDVMPNIINMNDLVIGKNWLNQDNPNRAIIDVPVFPNRTYYFLLPSNSKIIDNVAAIQMNASIRVNLKSDNIVETVPKLIQTTSNTSRICIQFNTGSLTATSDIFDGYTPYGCLGDFKETAVDKVARENSMPWEDKKLVWLGTSIPAGGRYDISNPNSYPIMVGELLGATVYNEAVGSSALHCKDPTRINANNPYGFLDNFEAVSRCITNSLVEQEWIINHFNDTNVFTKNVPASLSDADKEFIRSCSWEIKLQKYFTAEAFPDAWIIDHGHNDIPSVASEATYTAKESISGTQHNGYYSAGNFVESTASSYIEYDVTDELYVWISGTFGGWYDVYDIYDSDGNNIGFTRNATQTQVNALRVNVSNATTLRVSNINTLINTISVEKLKYPTYNSLYSYNGAFDFIVNKILTYNPRARIIMIGEYENQKYPTISENQLIASQRWEFPLYKQWENLGWSQQPILVNGEYKSMLNIIIPDNLHPHTDTTGYALHQMAKNIALWLNDIG